MLRIKDPLISVNRDIISILLFGHPDMKLIGISHLETALSCGDQLQIVSYESHEPEESFR